MKQVSLKILECLERADEENSQFLLEQAAKYENLIDDMQKKYLKRQIKRIRKGNCKAEAGILFSELLTDFERIGDYALIWLNYMPICRITKDGFAAICCKSLFFPISRIGGTSVAIPFIRKILDLILKLRKILVGNASFLYTTSSSRFAAATTRPNAAVALALAGFSAAFLGIFTPSLRISLEARSTHPPEYGAKVGQPIVSSTKFAK